MKPSVVRVEERVAAGGLPKGVIGQQAFHHDQGWVGFLRLEPGASSPWHHHGEWDSYGYVLEGVLRWDIYEPTTKRPAKVDHNAITADELRKRHEEYFKTMDAFIREMTA